MQQRRNSMACAWLEARDDLGIRVVHPFTFEIPGGLRATTVGVYLPDFGSNRGTLLISRFDPPAMDDLADRADYFQSGLNPECYEPYDRSTYIETLNDWGWFGPDGEAPPWFSGEVGRHGGAA